MGLLDVILGRDLGMPEWMKEEIEKEQPEPSVSPTQRSAVLEWLRQMGGQEGPNVSPAPGRPASREREEALYGPDPARLLAEQQAELARQAPQVQPPQPQIAPTPQAATRAPADEYPPTRRESP